MTDTAASPEMSPCAAMTRARISLSISDLKRLPTPSVKARNCTDRSCAATSSSTSIATSNITAAAPVPLPRRRPADASRILRSATCERCTLLARATAMRTPSCAAEVKLAREIPPSRMGISTVRVKTTVAGNSGASVGSGVGWGVGARVGARVGDRVGLGVGQAAVLHTRSDCVGQMRPPCACSRCTVTRRFCSPPPHDRVHGCHA